MTTWDTGYHACLASVAQPAGHALSMAPRARTIGSCLEKRSIQWRGVIRAQNGLTITKALREKRSQKGSPDPRDRNRLTLEQYAAHRVESRNR